MSVGAVIMWENALVSRKYMLHLCSDNSERTFNKHIYTSIHIDLYVHKTVF